MNVETSEEYPFLNDGGQLGELTRAFDWAATVIGSPGVWPQSLRTTVSLLLASKFPMLLWWGPEMIQFYNDAYLPTFGPGAGGKHPAALGQRAEDCWSETWAVIKPLIDQVWQTGEGTWREDQLISIHRNGRIEDTYWTFSYSPVRDELGQVGGILVVCSETTDQVNTLRRLEEREEQLRFAIDATDLATWDLNPITNRFDGNARLRSWFGLSVDADISLQNALDIIADEDRNRITQAIWTAILPGSAGQYDVAYTVVHPESGSRRVVRAKGRAHFGSDGVAYRFNGTLQDITTEVLAQQLLEKTNEDLLDSIRQFTFVTDFVPQIVWAAQPDGTHDFFNRKWYEFTGLTQTQLVDANSADWSQVLHPDDAERARQMWQHCLQTGDTYETEYRMKRHDGQYRWLLARALPLRDETGPNGALGTIVRWFGTCTDVHDQKTFTADLEHQVTQRTNALQLANFDLQRSNENLERFAYVASHDLQEPLRKIRSFGDILQSTYGSQLGEGVDFLNRMQTAADRMSVLIRDLLTFSRIRTQRETFAPVNLNKVIRGVLGDLELAIQEAGARVELDELPTVSGDAPQLRQLFQNLIANALKFHHPDLPPRICLSSQLLSATDLPKTIQPNSSASQFYAISVADNGIGFDEKYTDRIFQVFQRLHGRSRYSGTGIGLAIVQKVADNHNGAIAVASQPGQGATFTVYLPA